MTTAYNCSRESIVKVEQGQIDFISNFNDDMPAGSAVLVIIFTTTNQTVAETMFESIRLENLCHGDCSQEPEVHQCHSSSGDEEADYWGNYYGYYDDAVNIDMICEVAIAKEGDMMYMGTLGVPGQGLLAGLDRNNTNVMDCDGWAPRNWWGDDDYFSTDTHLPTHKGKKGKKAAKTAKKAKGTAVGRSNRLDIVHGNSDVMLPMVLAGVVLVGVMTVVTLRFKHDPAREFDLKVCWDGGHISSHPATPTSKLKRSKFASTCFRA